MSLLPWCCLPVAVARPVVQFPPTTPLSLSVAKGFAGRSDPDEELSEKELQKLRLPNRVVHGFLNLVHTMVVALVAVFMVRLCDLWVVF